MVDSVAGLVGFRIAVILPCFNEAPAIAGVVHDFAAMLPAAEIFVIDNNSTDGTADVAARAGAHVLAETMRGKGHAIRRAFSEIDADIYVMADGDGTYDASRAPELVAKLVAERLDMLVAIRRDTSEAAYRRGHRLGNRLFNWIVQRAFGNRFSDIFSGYRVFSRRFVKSFPALSTGFDIETEMSVHAIQLNVPTAEVPAEYRERAAGTQSKLNTYRDGLRILWRVVLLLKHLRPFALFGLISLAIAALSLILGVPVVAAFLETGRVERFPTAIAAASLGVMSLISFATGIILDTLAYAQRENKRMFYLATAPRAAARSKDG